MGFSPVNVSNNLLKRSFDENLRMSPMKLQKLLYFVAAEFAKKTGTPLLDEDFQAWQYGPVVRSVFDEFRGFRGNSISAYGKDAQGKAYTIDESRNPQLKAALDRVWAASKLQNAVALSRLTHAPESGWRKAYDSQANVIKHEDMVNDESYYLPLGLGQNS